MKNEIIIANHQQWFVRYMWSSMHSIEPPSSPRPHQKKKGAKDLVVRDLGQVTYHGHKFRDKLILFSFFNLCPIIQDTS